ncbi:sugar transport protein 5-like [Macadamia integrifolia]|uniref:sugar transport protein 5-like n=1 Tax=Macadamia integrifolia TaxID=60698 RepID=UPI001C4F5FCA|nr:sugar transport protein 5-like [Macadamia integrifolia]
MVIICMVAASAGLLFGYDIGVSGGVSTMEPFLEKFFPNLMRKMASHGNDNTYCMYDSQVLTLFTSSLYLAALVSSLFAGRFNVSRGRKATLVLGGAIFLSGALVISSAINVTMLIFGRVLLGIGIGFSNQAAPVYLSEMAPPKWRGAFATAFNFFMDIGIVTANVTNFFAAQLKVDWNWRLALGLAGVPAFFMTFGALFIPDTALSLVQRGRVKEARETLSQIRGVDSDVDAELMEIFNYNQEVKSKSGNHYNKIFQKKYRPHLVLSVGVMTFQQLTGVGLAAFYAPILFKSVGFGSNSALFGAVLLGVINLGSVMASCSIVDRVGRRVLFVVGGTTMFICQMVLAWLIAIKEGSSGDEPLTKASALAIMFVMCLFAAGFGFSWGPLSFLISSEVLPTEVRPVGNGIGISFNFMITFVLAQTFVSMLCNLKYVLFLFYAGWMVIMTTFVLLFLPETKGIALEAMHPIWEKHWYWRRFVERKTMEREREDEAEFKACVHNRISC